MSAPRPRTARPGPRVRLLRAAVFAAVCVVLAAAGHTTASCANVPLWTLGAGFAGSLLVMAPLAGRARSVPAIAALLALCQVALHTLFGLGQHTAQPMASLGTAHSGAADDEMVQRAAQLLCGSGPATLTPGQAYRLLLDARLIDASGRFTGHAATGGHASGMAGSPAGPVPSALSLLSLPMLLGHLLAALALGWLLRRGDLAVLRLVELSTHGVAEGALVRSLRAALALTRALYAGLLPAAGPAPRLRRTERDEAPVPQAAALQHSVIRRGPPADAFRLAA
ncbi:hypothetical protein E5082_12395 [Streptomyces griseoluteus]|uniref:Integral membrane protein n=1 Tax=Streptomyces griseoluteus TaxID=29306 RepID=A0A4Z1DJ40_STRGP|nr:hypothetical protein [Streptomyces griseoluteus]TGN83661.1 hypothetical protein E5082_12395 [Streptomyces griseoluteus]GHF04197.1 hypothetical protein GCM10017776_22180 [Streptomyces griseoluteus]